MKYKLLKFICFLSILILSFFCYNCSALQTYEIKIENGNYFVYKNNEKQTGWLTIEGKMYYLDPTTGEAAIGQVTIEGANYYFNNKGQMQTLLQRVGDKYYFYGRYSGKMQYGWLPSEGKMYYLDPTTGEAAIGQVTIEGANYYFNNKGQMQTLLQRVGDKYYFYGRYSGKMQYGWLPSEGKMYYLDPTTGEAASGQVTIEGANYYFNDKGQMQIGIQTIDDKTYYFNNNGQMQVGFQLIKEDIYYFDEQGIMQYGWLELDGYKYYLGEDGKLFRLLQEIDGKYYFFGRYSGKMQYGWLPSEGKMYYLDPTTGEMYTGLHIIDNVEYTFRENGTLISQYIQENGLTRYIFSDGTYANDWITITGEKCFFNSNGYLIGKNVKKVIDVSAHQGIIDWDTVKVSGDVDGVILRISAGSANEDQQLARNVSELNRLEIPYGIYIYSYAEDMISNVSDLGTMHEGALEGARVVNTIKKYNMKLSLPIYYDLEVWENGKNRLWNSNIYTNIVKQFDQVLTSYGYDWQIYTNKNWADTALNAPYLRNKITWIAQYNHFCTYTGNYNMWQYSSTESIAGITGNVDVSVLFNN